MAWNWTGAGTGAASGAGAGAAAGPWGALIGGVAGGVIGGLTGGDDGPTAEERQLVAWLKAQAAGQGPSAALQAMQQAQSKALSTARSGVGNPYLNLRMANEEMGDIAQKGALARIEEIAAARKQLADWLLGMRGARERESDRDSGQLGGAFSGASQVLGMLASRGGAGGKGAGSSSFGSSGKAI